jgi:UDP-N-acetylmuramoyl-tripeptide--D-alanyl-D-alanine ligase
MPELSIDEICRATGGVLSSASGSRRTAKTGGYSIDTRLIERGDVFFALKGEHADGHAYVADAYRRGAIGAVVAQPIHDVPVEFIQITVPSPLAALQDLASHVRSSLEIDVVAISGSNGKTTTKEMLALLLAKKMRVHKSPGNFNNHIGVPLSILGADGSTDILVVEMGSNHRGEIRRLCEIARPTTGVITNIGTAHIGLFGSVREIAMEKTDLVRSLERGGRAIVNGDDPLIASALAESTVSTLTYGIQSEAEFRAREIKNTDGSGSRFIIGGVSVELRIPGIHNIYNACAAIAAASVFGISPEDAGEVLPSFEPLRMKTASCAGITVIDDSYNANPDSIKAALDVLSSMKGPRKIFVMGEMLELGDESVRLHRQVGRMIAADVGFLIGIGGLTAETVGEARASGMDTETSLFFETKDEAKHQISRMLRQGDVVLVKGSRMTGLDEICEFLKEASVEGRN